MTPITRRAALGLMGAAAGGPLWAEPVFLNGMGVAINGYDPTGFIDMQEAIRGRMEHQIEREDGLWWFASAANRRRFEADPDRYIPQFGGYCAQGIALGFKRRSDPTLWVLIDGKVYMHYSIPDQNRWAADVRGSIAKAEENWPTLKDL
ncbi:YHS domain protein [Halovulum dunhuangense]|uniref:YHS domain protein n=1 Tax=Halovulum dunhuangense TaxID=1505036 RepID=A0A849L469_9RHOB|nr:YHS domain-containing (seleno)protein [Halovulum dunhuangense]NNU81135.1 YHS domain protein [Halovulum dunhuangense]